MALENIPKCLSMSTARGRLFEKQEAGSRKGEHVVRSGGNCPKPSRVPSKKNTMYGEPAAPEILSTFC